MTEKLIKDGKVAVLIHPDYGAGWSTWSYEKAEELVFDKDIAQAVIDKDFEKANEIACRKYPEETMLRTEELKVVWLPAGEEFRLTEYDGYEHIHLKKHEHYYTA